MKGEEELVEHVVLLASSLTAAQRQGLGDPS